MLKKFSVLRVLKIWPISKTWTFYPFFNTKHSIPDFFFISHCLYVPRGCITCIMLKYWNTCHVLASMSGVKPSTPNLTSYNFDHSYLFASISTPSSVFFLQSKCFLFPLCRSALLYVHYSSLRRSSNPNFFRKSSNFLDGHPYVRKANWATIYSKNHVWN